MTAGNLPWPDQPYRGLNYFRPQDRPLFAGRDNDVEICSTLLAHPETRVLLLHGLTGCGKSSFLRAGLIPAMEEADAGYLFLKLSGSDDEALFIRCTEAPVDQIIRQVYLFCSAPFFIRTPNGNRELDLRPALLGANAWEDYLDKARADNRLVESLRCIAEIIPQTLVLIVDQAEEVLTLNPSEVEFMNRIRFFRLLRTFQELQFDARIIVTLRTEYFGRFIDAIRINGAPGGAFEQFFLAELTTSALIEAVLRPTSKLTVGLFGVPYERYKFSFSEGLPERIVTDIQKAKYSGPALPILQLACLYLYKHREMKGDTLIEYDTYRSLGGVEGALTRHITEVIASSYSREADLLSDSDKLAKFLSSFYVVQDDQSIVSRTINLETAQSNLMKLDLHINAAGLMSRLSSPQAMILRKIQSAKSDGVLANEVTLAHDSIAIGVERWKSLLLENKLSRSRTKYREFYGYMAGAILIFSVLAAIFSIITLKISAREGLEYLSTFVAIVSGVVSLSNFVARKRMDKE